jgi:hypothetical protein
MPSDCYAIAQQNCFPTTVAEVYADAAASQVACYAIASANLDRYQNAFCTPDPYCFSPCGTPQDTSDDCGFQCIYRKYGNGCAYNLCNPYDQVSYCNDSYTSSTYKKLYEKNATALHVSAVSYTGFGCACTN